MLEVYARVNNIMTKYGYPWFIAGDLAIDLFLKRETAKSRDVVIGIFRKDQMKLYKYFEKNKKRYIDNTSRIGKLETRIWNKEYLRLPVCEIEIDYGDIEIKVLLNEIEGEKWINGINSKTSRDSKQVILFTENRIPYLCPEIVMLNKIKDCMEIDKEEVSTIAKKMDGFQREWLIANINDKDIKEKIRNLTIAST